MILLILALLAPFLEWLIWGGFLSFLG